MWELYYLLLNDLPVYSRLFSLFLFKGIIGTSIVNRLRRTSTRLAIAAGDIIDNIHIINSRCAGINVDHKEFGKNILKITHQ